MWPARHHAVVTVLAAGVLSIMLWRWHTTSAIAPLEAALAQGAALKLDPNTASERDLAALPGMGASRARSLVTYRQQRQAETGQVIVFHSLRDLDPIKGIGAATLEKLGPNLRFPEAGP